ncbi:MAG: GtrA family protein [Muribaculum sp.]|nr:GtrA family protein [Muribaculum sp.]
MMNNTSVLQFIKYAIVGVMNTLVTLVVIFLCKNLLDINPLVANAIGYVAGLINSFVWNKRWVFRSSGQYVAEAVKFGCGFLLCYGLQLLTVWLLYYHSPLETFEMSIGAYTLSGYGVSTLIGNVVYTLVNFAYNRVVTFKS